MKTTVLLSTSLLLWDDRETNKYLGIPKRIWYFSLNYLCFFSKLPLVCQCPSLYFCREQYHYKEKKIPPHNPNHVYVQFKSVCSLQSQTQQISRAKLTPNIYILVFSHGCMSIYSCTRDRTGGWTVNQASGNVCCTTPSAIFYYTDHNKALRNLSVKVQK